MTGYRDIQTGQEEEELTGPEQYLRAGEELLVYATEVQIKKFLFEVYLTDGRLFLVDQNEKKPGVCAKEIPVQSIVEGYLEQAPTQEPILVLSIRTSDDDIRTMKMTFLHTGKDRTTEVEEWIHLIQHGRREVSREPVISVETQEKTPFVAPQARDVSETMVFPTPPPSRAKDIPPPAEEEVKQETQMSPWIAQKAETPPPVHASPSRTQILFCHHCGRRIPPNANFCPFCGTRMHQSPVEEPQAPQPIRSETHETPPAEEKKSGRKRRWKIFRRK